MELANREILEEAKLEKAWVVTVFLGQYWCCVSITEEWVKLEVMASKQKLEFSLVLQEP